MFYGAIVPAAEDRDTGQIDQSKNCDSKQGGRQYGGEQAVNLKLVIRGIDQVSQPKTF